MNATQRWIGDYRSVGLVDWPGGLREALRARLRRANRMIMLWVVIPAITLFLWAVVHIVDSFAGLGFTNPAIGGIGFMVGGAAVAVCCLPGNDYHKIRLSLKRALRCAQLERFRLGDHVNDEIDTATLLGLGASIERVTDQLPRTLLVNPRRSLLLQVDDGPLDLPCEVVIRTIGVNAAARVTSGFAEIELTPCERDELRGFVARLREEHLKSLVMLGFLSIPLQSLVLIAKVLWEAASLLYPRKDLDGRVLIRDLKLDLRFGLTEIVDGDRAVAEFRQVGAWSQHVSPVTPIWVRRLSVSKVWWEVEGVPAIWRRS